MVIILIILIKIEWRDEKADKVLCIVTHVTVNRSSVSIIIVLVLLFYFCMCSEMGQMTPSFSFNMHIM